MYKSIERLKLSLNFKEPDRVPFDLGGTTVTSISKIAFERAMTWKGLNGSHVNKLDIDPIQQIVFPSEQVLDVLKVDTYRLGLPRLFGGVNPISYHNGKYVVKDQFSCQWEFDPSKDYYYNQVYSPLKTYESIKEALEKYSFPSLKGKKEEVFLVLDQLLPKGDSRALILDRNCAGLTEIALRLRGYEEFFIDSAIDLTGADRLLNEVLNYKLEYWEYMSEYVKKQNLQQKALVAVEADDLGTQESLLFSPKIIREIVLPKYEMLITYIKKSIPGIKVFFHTDGAIFELIPDLIKIGVDILNPVQFSARGMDLKRLKQEYSKDIVFWGGVIDTQETLPHATPQQIKDQVKQNIEILAPGGGFVCAAVHNIQADVPPENFWAYWEAVQEYGVY